VKRPATIHPLAVARSLERQNEALGFFLGHVSTVVNLAPNLDIVQLRDLITRLGVETGRVRKVFWPESE
jgi:hypothetical protein